MTPYIILAVTRLLLVQSYTTEFNPEPQIEIVASCRSWLVFATDIDRSTKREYKKYRTAKNTAGQKEKCYYLSDK